MSVDKDFTAMVEAWEQKLGVAEPDGRLGRAAAADLGQHQGRDRTFRRAGAAGVAGGAAAAARSPRSPSRAAAADTFQRDPVLPAGRGAGATVATATTAIAAALVAMIAVGPISRTCCPTASPQAADAGGRGQDPGCAGSAVRAICRRAAEGGRVARVHSHGRWRRPRNFTIRKVGAPAEPGKSFELWLISDKLPRPRSLGVIGGSDFNVSPVLASYDPDRQRRDLCGDGRAGRRLA